MNLPAKQLTIEEAMANLEAIDGIKERPEFQVIQGALKGDIISLGVDEAFALKDADGEIKAFRQRLTLSENEGTLIKPTPQGPFVISAQGYEKWAESAGACVIFPKEVLVNHQLCLNPFAERDTKNRRILAVHARAVAFRFSSKGIPQVSDWTTIFDTPSYRLIDLLAKAKKFPQAFRLLPSDMEKPEEEGTWTCYPFDESTKLWVDTSHEEALKWYSQILNREKKSMDFAQTFAKRNALKHLSALQKAPGPVWDMSVLCWRPVSGNIIKWDSTVYSQLQSKVGGLITDNGNEFRSDTPQIESKTGNERVSDEAGFETIESETDPEDQQPIDVPHETVSETKAPAEKEENVESLTDKAKKLFANYHATKDNFPSEYRQAVKELQLDQFNEKNPTFEHADAVMKKVEEIVDLQIAE